MHTDPTGIEALRRALESDPNNASLRIHLASLYFNDQEYDSALREAQTVLQAEPTNLEALGLAADASEKLGDLGKAKNYRTLVRALSSASDPSTARNTDAWAEFIVDEPGEEKPTAMLAGNNEFLGDDLVVDLELSDLRLSDVAGLERVKRRLNLAFLSPLKNPEMMQLYGKSLR